MIHKQMYIWGLKNVNKERGEGTKSELLNNPKVVKLNTNNIHALFISRGKFRAGSYMLKFFFQTWVKCA